MSSISEQLMTAEEFLAWTQREENRDRFFELERGKVMEMPPAGVVEMPSAGKYDGSICANIIRLLGNYAAEKGGHVCSNDAGIFLERNPDTVRGPDLSYREDAQTAEDIDRGYGDHPPRLAVEVISPHDRVNPMMHRVAELLRAGVGMVWVHRSRSSRHQRVPIGTRAAITFSGRHPNRRRRAAGFHLPRQTDLRDARATREGLDRPFGPCGEH